MNFNKDYVINYLNEIKNYTDFEVAVSGGKYDFVKIGNSKFIQSKSAEKYNFNIRGIYKNNYFSFISNSPNVNDVKNELLKKQTIKSENKVYFCESKNYRNVQSFDENLKDYNNLLTFNDLSSVYFKLLKENIDINGYFYNKIGTISPFSEIYPPFLIFNNKNLYAFYNNTRIIVNLTLKHKDISQNINCIISNLNDIDKFNENIEKYLKYIKIPLKNIENTRYKIIFSKKSVSKLLWMMQKSFSSSYYFGNKSLFRNNLHKKIFSNLINIEDTPFHPLLNGKPFDDFGEEKQITPLIDKGYLRGLTFNYNESILHKNSQTFHNDLTLNHSIPNYLYLKGSNTKLSEILNNEEVLFIDDISMFDCENLLYDEKFDLKTEGISFLYKKGNISNIVKDISIKLSFKDIFLNIIEITEESESIGFVVPELFVDKIT